jgi:hypothetical protein
VANFIYNEFKKLALTGALDLSSDDIRVMLVMTGTTCDTEDDADNFAAFTTIDEYDGGSYARVALTSEAVNEDAPNNRAEFDAADAVFSAIGAGTSNCQAAVIFKEGATDSLRIPIAYIDQGGFPFNGTGSDVTIQWNAEGILQAS